MSIIYKYRGWNETHKSLLTKNILWFPSAKSLRKIDPSEMTNYVDFTKVEESKRLPYFFKVAERKDPNRSVLEIINEANDLFFREKSNNWNIYNNMGKVYGESIGNKMGICSLSETNDLDHQWKNYSNNFFGFCVGFDLDILRNYIGGHGGIIRYVQELDHPAPTFDLMIDAFTVHCTKLVKYENEKEHRYLKGNERLKEDEEYKDQGYKIPIETYREIIIGNKLLEDKNVSEELTEIIQKRYSHCKILKSFYERGKISISAI
jgi:hypothetical protein